MRIGITGHQNLSTSEIEWLKLEIDSEIKSLKIQEAYSCLAIGADQLFANLILKNKIPLIAIIPCKDYEKTFNTNNLIDYTKLLRQTSKTIQLNFDKPSEEAFYEAGKSIINICDIIFAVWNNLPAKGLGGTGDVVSFANDKNKKIIQFNPINKTKKYINYG